MTLFLLASVALLLTQDSSISANTASRELDSAQADYVARAGMQHALWQTTNNACSGNVNIPATFLGKHSYTATMTSAANTNVFIVGADRDTHLDPANPKTNYGSETTATVKNDPPDSSVALYHFDVSSVAKGARVASATAWFYVDDNDPLGATEVRSMDLDWTETGATWANAGAGVSKTVYGLLPPQDSTGVWVNVNLTALVQSWANEPTTNHGIVLSGTSDKEMAKYTTREYSNSNQRPFLQVTVADDEVSPVVIKAIGTLVNGVERTLTQPNAVAYQPPVLYTVSPGPAESADAEIWDDEPNNNYGDEEETWVSSAAGDTTRSLLRFSVGAIPVGARIVDATLLMHRQSGSTADEPVSAHRITNSWSEDSVTWNRRESGTSWNTAGGDFHSVAVATATVGAGNQNPEWNLTPLVQGWVDGSYPNYGVALVAGIDGMEGERFYTSDQPQLDRRPSLSVSYACDCGSPCLSQGGEGKVLMVVGNATNMWYYDIQKKAILESWGYTVNIIDDGASAAAFDAAIAANDVAYISEPSSEASVNTKLSNAPIGVVSDEGRLNDELGMAQSYATPVLGTAIKVTDTSHYITKVFPVGPLDIYTAAMEGLTVAGAEAPELQTLADWGAAGSLVTLEAGATTVSGGSSTGRRVMLPFGRQIDSYVDWDRLSSNGRLIAQRAIAWAIGNDKKSPGKLLLVVGNAPSPSSGDLDRQALIESWGYAVTLIDDGDSPANFNIAVAENDVVYVAGSGSSATVGTKLTAATVGVLSEDIGLVDELGIAEASFVKKNSQSINVIDNTHYVTSGFSLGELQLYSYVPQIWTVTGALAPGLQLLGETQDGGSSFPPGLAILEAGAELYGGGLAAGRRVQVPWAQGSFDITALNAYGRTIMQRAIEWGAGAGPNAMLPIAHWKLDDGIGETAIDSEGGHDGTLTNDPVWVGGRLGGALDFDGVNDYVDVGTFDVSGTGLTMMAWFNAESIPTSDGRLISKANGSSESEAWWQISTTDVGADRYLRMRIKAGGTTTTFRDSSVKLTAGQWYFAVATYSNSGEMKLYLDGVEVASGNHAVGGPVDADPTVPVAIGANGTAERFFDGVLDDVRVYGRALGAAEIADLHADGLPGPVAHWKLDEGTGPTAVDSEGGHDGTLTNDPVWVGGRLGDALDFDGVNDYVDVGTFDVSGTGLTMMAWFNAESIPTSDGRFISKATGSSESEAWWQISTTDVGADRFLRMRIKAGGTTTTFRDSSVKLTAGQWYFAVATYSNSGEMKLYLDGVEVASGNHAVGGPVDADPTVPVAIGANGTAERFFDGVLDDIRLYDYPLNATEVADLFAAGGGGGGGSSYIEAHREWAATSDDTWQTVSLSSFGVPASAVVEVAITNSNAANQRWGGLREVGSGLDRRLQLHEAENGGVDVATMHVQANASSEIQHYSDRTADVKFTLLGYWTGAVYVELFDSFTADASNAWVEEDVSNDGLGPNQVADIVMMNSNQWNERLAGVRAVGSSNQRRFNLHEAESGGVDTYSMTVGTDASSNLEVFAQSAANIEFVVLGYWSTPPGTYVENGVGVWTASSTSWETKNLSGAGVPANAVVQVSSGNFSQTGERFMGVRQVGSSLSRRFDLQEAEGGGTDRVTWHVNVDASTNIQSYAEVSGTASRFAPVGWWILN